MLLLKMDLSLLTVFTVDSFSQALTMLSEFNTFLGFKGVVREFSLVARNLGVSFNIDIVLAASLTKFNFVVILELGI